MGLRPTPRGLKMGYAEHARRASRLLPSTEMRIFIAEGKRRGSCCVFRNRHDARVRVQPTMQFPPRKRCFHEFLFSLEG